jgi:hypothetical protein
MTKTPNLHTPVFPSSCNLEQTLGDVDRHRRPPRTRACNNAPTTLGPASGRRQETRPQPGQPDAWHQQEPTRSADASSFQAQPQGQRQTPVVSTRGPMRIVLTIHPHRQQPEVTAATTTPSARTSGLPKKTQATYHSDQLNAHVLEVWQDLPAPHWLQRGLVRVPL